MPSLRVVYMGTPDFAVPALEALIANPNYEVAGVVTNPDRPSGRGKKLTPPPVKVVAERAGVEVFQPQSLKTDEAFEHIAAWEPDVIVVAAYGQILRQRMLDLPRYGCLNIHASLLPKYRGAAPINWCLVRGEEETGVTIMQMERGLDTGPMLLKGKTPIAPLETAQQLHDRLAELGAELIIDALGRLRLGSLDPVVQDDTLSSYAPMLTKAEGLIDWTRSATEVANHIRGFNPWPGAYAFHDRDGEQHRIKFHRARPVKRSMDAEPGQVLAAEPATGEFLIACGTGAIAVIDVQAPGKKAMSAANFLNGYVIAVNERFIGQT